MSTTFEFWSLAITRLLSTIVTIYAISVLVGMWVKQPTEPAKRAVPRPILMFTLGWLGVLTSITGFLVMSGSPAISDGMFRAIYGMSFVWSIAGLGWIVALGRTAYAMAIAQHEVERVARKAKVPPCPEDDE